MAEAPIVMPAIGSALMPRQVGNFIFEDIARTSAVQQVIPEHPLPAEGVAIPVMTGKPVAAWVNEAGRKPISDAGMTFLTMEPKKIAVIVPFSEEFLRTDRVDLFGMLRPAIAEAFAIAFDYAALFDAGPTGTLTAGPFATNLAQTNNDVILGTTAANGGIYKDLVNGYTMLVNEPTGPYRVTGWIANDVFEPLLMGSVDVDGRPIFTTNGIGGSVQQALLNRPVAYTRAFVDEGAPTNPPLAFGGDVRMARWGRGQGISYSISREATLYKGDMTPISLWQENLVALRAEAEFGFVVADPEAFFKVYPTGTTGT